VGSRAPNWGGFDVRTVRCAVTRRYPRRSNREYCRYLAARTADSRNRPVCSELLELSSCWISRVDVRSIDEIQRLTQALEVVTDDVELLAGAGV
jgi:hypothetical protein